MTAPIGAPQREHRPDYISDPEITRTPTGVVEVTNAWGTIWDPRTWRRPAWFNLRVARTEVLSGLVVALALIPEAIAFSLIAGVDPRVGLFASFVMAVSIAFLGGRPAMISAATAAVALIVAPLARDHGLDYLVAAVITGGMIQVIFAVLGVAKLMRFIPRSVMVGFVNSLAILIFMAQFPHLTGVTWMVYPLVALALLIIMFLPKLTTVVPAPLVAIVVLTTITAILAIAVPTVGDEGELPEGLPLLFFPDVPWNLDTLQLVFPFALGIAMVGLLESLMTAKLVDDITDTHSDKTREAWGQGASNIIVGFFGGMGGCAMIGQTMINVKAGRARTRLSTFMAGVFLLVLILTLGPVVAMIPMAALVAVMIYVSWATFDWHSVQLNTLKRMPRSETAVMLTTVVVVVVTHNLAYGVIAGVLLAMVMFARRVAHLANVEGGPIEGNTRRYTVTGELFFASSNDLFFQFDYAGDPENVIIDMHGSHLWDASTVAALDSVVTKYARHGTTVDIQGLNEDSLKRHDRLAGHMGAGH
ncbi:MAG: sodium-independent anion transporter [Actinobacteria bacterium HGW-Actinobacteria-4]|nr:MAG: sodium-independent anion transporter [Actinobacteria bacterium HGW-Actinobacteria-4]